MTFSEVKLWNDLKNGKMMGYDFDRQRPIGNYIVDFYCSREKLIIETDGQSHYDAGGQNYDEFRDNRLTNLGFTILRFENKLVFHDIESVLDEIRAHCKSEGPHHPR